MGLFDRIRRKAEKHNDYVAVKCDMPLRPYQTERLASNCFNSLVNHIDEIAEAVKGTFEEDIPFKFEATALMYSMADSFLNASGISDACRKIFYGQVISYCEKHFTTYVGLYSDNGATSDEALKDRFKAYDPFTANSRVPTLLWAPAEYEDDISPNLILMGNYLQYSVFSSALYLGNPFRIPKSRLDAIEAFDFASVMAELNLIIGGYGFSVTEFIKHERSLL